MSQEMHSPWWLDKKRAVSKVCVMHDQSKIKENGTYQDKTSCAVICWMVNLKQFTVMDTFTSDALALSPAIEEIARRWWSWIGICAKGCTVSMSSQCLAKSYHSFGCTYTLVWIWACRESPPLKGFKGHQNGVSITARHYCRTWCTAYICTLHLCLEPHLKCSH